MHVGICVMLCAVDCVYGYLFHLYVLGKCLCVGFHELMPISQSCKKGHEHFIGW